MPFRLPLSLAASLPDNLVRRQREPRQLLLIAERPDLRITAQVPDEDHVIHHDLLLRPARAFPKGSPATARIHLGSHRDRRPAAADPLPRAQPEQPQRTFLAGPLTHCRRGPDRKVRSRNARSATSVCCWEPRGPTGKPVTGAAACAWRGVWVPRPSPGASELSRRREGTGEPVLNARGCSEESSLERLRGHQ